MSGRPLVFVQENSRPDNLGDVLINEILRDELRARGDVHSLRSGLSLRSALSAVRAGRRAYFFLPPGHHFATSSPRSRDAWRLLTKARLLALLGVRICRVGFSLGPLCPGAERLERSLVNAGMHAYAVRDPVSLEYANRIGIRRATFFPDLAWFLPSPQRSAVATSRDLVVLSFRGSVLGEADGIYRGPERGRLLSVLERVAVTAAERGKALVLAHQVAADGSFCSEIHAALRRRGHAVELVNEQLDRSAADQLYARAHAIVSNRLHVLLLAMARGALGVAVISRERHTKITALLEHAGLERLIVDLDASTDVGTRVDACLQNEVGERIQATFSRLREQGRATLDELFRA